MLSPTGEAIQWKERAAEKGHGRNDEVGQQRLIRMGFDMQSKRYGKAEKNHAFNKRASQSPGAP